MMVGMMKAAEKRGSIQDIFAILVAVLICEGDPSRSYAA